ncbi:MAG: hypothetical protein HN337_03860, partial [Deltaproteobacteria bacterium]|nr:hypothetical protein [Deltaproteobacteria bacterium]
ELFDMPEVLSLQDLPDDVLIETANSYQSMLDDMAEDDLYSITTDTYDELTSLAKAEPTIDSSSEALLLLKEADMRVVWNEDNRMIVAADDGWYAAYSVLDGKVTSIYGHYFEKSGLYFDGAKMHVAQEVSSTNNQFLIRYMNASHDEWDYVAFEADPISGVRKKIDSYYFSDGSEVGKYYEKKHGISDALILTEHEINSHMIGHRRVVLLESDGKGGYVPAIQRAIDNYRYITDDKGFLHEAHLKRIGESDLYYVELPLTGRAYDFDRHGLSEYVHCMVNDKGVFRKATQYEVEVVFNEYISSGMLSPKLTYERPTVVGHPIAKMSKGGDKGYEQIVRMSGAEREITVFVQGETIDEFDDVFNKLLGELENTPAELTLNVRRIEVYKEGYDADVRGSYGKDDQVLEIYDYAKWVSNIKRGHKTLDHEFGHALSNIPNEDELVVGRPVIMSMAIGGSRVDKYYRRATQKSYFGVNWRERFAEAVRLYANRKTRTGLIENDPAMVRIIEDLIMGRIKGKTVMEQQLYDKIRKKLTLGLGITMSASGLLLQGDS